MCGHLSHRSSHPWDHRPASFLGGSKPSCAACDSLARPVSAKAQQDLVIVRFHPLFCGQWGRNSGYTFCSACRLLMCRSRSDQEVFNCFVSSSSRRALQVLMRSSPFPSGAETSWPRNASRSSGGKSSAHRCSKEFFYRSMWRSSYLRPQLQILPGSLWALRRIRCHVRSVHPPLGAHSPEAGFRLEFILPA